MDLEPNFASGPYWEARYRSGRGSGAGSHGRLARYKADVINRFIADNRVASVIDLGCGDGSQLGLLRLPEAYIGLDVSPAAVASCSEKFPGRRFLLADQAADLAPAELTLALDIVYHLTEDAVFAATMHRLFALSTRFVLIYSSNVEATWPSPHVRHRAFTRHVAGSQPHWRLVAHMPNPCPFDPARPDDTSFADFFAYARLDTDCALYTPSSGANTAPGG